MCSTHTGRGVFEEVKPLCENCASWMHNRRIKFVLTLMRLVQFKRNNACRKRENLRISMRMDLEVLSSFDLIITTSTSDSE